MTAPMLRLVAMMLMDLKNSKRAHAKLASVIAPIEEEYAVSRQEKGSEV